MENLPFTFEAQIEGGNGAKFVAMVLLFALNLMSYSVVAYCLTLAVRKAWFG